MTTPTLAPALGKQCADIVHHSDGSFTGYNAPCKAKAKYHEEGKDWCARHTPTLVAARIEKDRADWQHKYAADEEAKGRQAAEHAALAGIANPAAVPEALAALDSLIGWAAFNTDWAKAGRAGEEPPVHPLGRARIAFTALGLDRKEPV